MSFEDSIKQWVTIDNSIKELNEKIKELRSKKSDLTSNINEYVNNNDLKHATVKISDGEIKFKNVKVTQPITLKFIKECLSDCISNENSVDKIMDYIKENRESKYVEDIKRFYN